MNGILIAAHGSRAKHTIDTLNAIVEMVKSKLPDTCIEIGYMEFCEPNISDGLKHLTDMGIKSIKVVPYFLFDGIHIREDIPNEINKFLAQSSIPDVRIEMGKTLGADERLAEIVVDRIKE